MKLNWKAIGYLTIAVFIVATINGLLDFPVWLNMLIGGAMGWYWPWPILIPKE